MRSNRLYIQSATRYAVLAPLIATAATIYPLCGAFQGLDTSQATWRTAAEGIVRAVATTGALGFISILLLVLYERGKRPR
jgi:biopolymer transport protein ExbB/TolQ